MSGPSLYPLYDELERRSKLQTEQAIDIKRLCNTINSIAQTHTPQDTADHYSEIMALILHYVFKHTGAIPLSIPYDARIMVGGKGILYTLTNMPGDLQRILAQYIEDPNIISVNI